MPTDYYTFELNDGTQVGLVREIKDDEGYTLERVRAGLWVDDPSLFRHFADPGDSQLVAISEVEAAELARRHVIAL